ncbi:MAG: DUF1738 domain-containing protein [Bacteroidales bacterium]|nr:DUF1738 domain-containing protein [Bacteroidales bacterium]
MSQSSIYQMVTDRIVEQLNAGVVPWRQPWVGGPAMAISYTSRKAYSMLNQFLLGRPGEWLTFNQIQQKGGRIRRGAKSRFCVFYQRRDEEKPGEEPGIVHVETRFILKWYRVFHIDDTTGIDSLCTAVVPNPDIAPIEAAERALLAYLEQEPGLKFVCDRPSDSAYYAPALDEVVVPMLSQYEIPEEYYSTAFHELTHSTMAESRCNRKPDKAITRFGDADYSREELVAEIGSAMILGRLGIDSDRAFRNSTAYIQNWLSALKNDIRMIVWASGKAEQAARYILNEQGPEG